MEALPQLPCTAELKPWEQFLFNFTSGTSSLKWDQSSIWTNAAKETFTDIKLATFNTEATDTDILNAFGLQVPEPATASLSLLGLAALMVRRRRKA